MPGQISPPEYQRVASHLREQIRADRWSEKEPLPTDVELGREFGVSRQTVRRAYLDLVNEGLVYRVRGRGTFITPSHLRYRRPFETVDDLLDLSEDTDLEVIQPLAGSYDPAAAAALQVDSRLLYEVQIVRRHRGDLFCHTTVWLPPAVGERLTGHEDLTTLGRRTPSTVIGALISAGVEIHGADQSTTARAADPRDVEVLGVEEGSPLLRIERTYFDRAGHPVEFAVSDFLPEHYTHRLHLGRRPNSVRPSAEKHHPSKGSPS